MPPAPTPLGVFQRGRGARRMMTFQPNKRQNLRAGPSQMSFLKVVILTYFPIYVPIKKTEQ